MAVSKVILNGTTLIDTTDKTVTAGGMLKGLTALKNDGTTATGSIALKSSTDLTASGATVTAPAGYYAYSARKSVASGTAGTPTASKGTVSNHSISVTPSVTNTTGYISGGTKSGTAVTVSASELVSGTKSITENGTGIDVTNFASVDVAVSGGGSAVQYGTFRARRTYTGSTIAISSMELISGGIRVQVLLYPSDTADRDFYAVVQEDGYMYVPFWSGGDSYTPRVTATSGEATQVAYYYYSLPINNLGHPGVYVVYKVSQGAVLDVSYYNNN